VATEPIAVNTGPLILLDKAGALDVIAFLDFQFVCPPAVRVEINAGTAKGYPAINPPWLLVVALKNPVSLMAQATLDLGEAEVIQLALENGYKYVCLDDLRGRRIAQAAGLRVTGALGLLALAKSKGVIPAIKPYTDRLLQAGAWYSPQLIKRVLEGVNE